MVTLKDLVAVTSFEGPLANGKWLCDLMGLSVASFLRVSVVHSFFQLLFLGEQIHSKITKSLKISHFLKMKSMNTVYIM